MNEVEEVVLEPASVGELQGILRAESKLRIEGSGSKASWRLPAAGEATRMSLWKLEGVIDFSPKDQVVSVQAGTRIEQLQDVLAKEGQCLPLRRIPELRQSLGTVGGSLSMNLPHVLEAQCGSWRDWVLGVSVVLADGTAAKSGSHAVKNVAGYDVHRLLVGARGTQAVITEVILRTFPLRSLPQPTLRHRGVPPDPPEQLYVQRTLRTDFARACDLDGNAGFDDMASSTVWRFGAVPAKRYAGDWVMACGSGEGNLRLEDETQAKLMKRAKQIFDPSDKLNPGEMGTF